MDRIHLKGCLGRVLLIGSATLLAGLIFLVTMRADPGDPATPAHQRRWSCRPRPHRRSIPMPAIQICDSTPPVSDMEGPLFTRINERGQLIQIFAKRSRPKPQGRHEVDWPGARIYLTPYRLLEIRAVKGTFLAPDNQPRNGESQGRVVLTLLKPRPDRRLDTSPNSPDIRMRVFLQDTKFNLDLGTIECDPDSPVHLTSPRVDFQGTGLQLTYSEGRSRMEHLEIERGKLLRIQTGAPAGQTRGAGSPASARGPSSPVAGKNGAPPTFYLATFDREVRINGKDATIDADRLQAIFSMGGSNPVLGGNGPQPAAFGGASATAQPSTTAPASPPGAAPPPDSGFQAADSPLPDDQSMMPVSESDLNVTWAGQLTVDPDDNPPPDLHSAQDSLLTLDGRPIKITTGRRETITAASLDYFPGTGRVSIEGSDDFPMAIDMDQMGILRGPRLVIDQATGTGWIPGAGSLRAHGAQPDILDAIEPKNRLNSAGGGLPPGMVTTWTKPHGFDVLSPQSPCGSVRAPAGTTAAPKNRWAAASIRFGGSRSSPSRGTWISNTRSSRCRPSNCRWP